MQANEYMKSSVLHPPVKSMRSWGLGGEAVPLETVQMMHEVRERQAAVARSTAQLACSARTTLLPWLLCRWQSELPADDVVRAETRAVLRCRCSPTCAASTRMGPPRRPL